MSGANAFATAPACSYAQRGHPGLCMILKRFATLGLIALISLGAVAVCGALAQPAPQQAAKAIQDAYKQGN
jgi:hypothetical protein